MKRETAAPGTGWVRIGMVERRRFAAEKVDSNVGFHSSDFPGPLRALVSGAQNLGGGAKKTAIKINHSKEPLETGFI